MFFISKKRFNDTVKQAVDKRLAESGKEVIVHKTEEHHHHHYSEKPVAQNSARQDGSNINGPSEAISKTWK